MPSENTPFTPLSILFRPHGLFPRGEEMVEAPGTAPGSDGFITMAIYRHSRCRQDLYRLSGRGLQTPREASVPASTLIGPGV